MSYPTVKHKVEPSLLITSTGSAADLVLVYTGVVHFMYLTRYPSDYEAEHSSSYAVQAIRVASIPCYWDAHSIRELSLGTILNFASFAAYENYIAMSDERAKRTCLDLRLGAALRLRS